MQVAATRRPRCELLVVLVAEHERYLHAHRAWVQMPASSAESRLAGVVRFGLRRRTRRLVAGQVGLAGAATRRKRAFVWCDDDRRAVVY